VCVRFLAHCYVCVWPSAKNSEQRGQDAGWDIHAYPTLVQLWSARRGNCLGKQHFKLFPTRKIDTKRNKKKVIGTSKIFAQRIA
jgi:hypothetical protein